MPEAVASDVRKLYVRDIMTQNPIIIDSDRTVREAAIAMDRSGVGCVLVTTKKDGHDRVIGIITERDLVRRALAKEGDASELRVKSIMSSSPIVISPSATIEEAAKTMERNKVRRLPVVDQAALTGVIAVSDLAKASAKQLDYSDALLNAMARVSAPKGIYA